MAGLTVANVVPHRPDGGSGWFALYTIAFDDSYVTGGEALTKAQLGYASTTDPTFYVKIAGKSGYTFEYDYTLGLVLAYRAAGFTPAGTNSVPTSTKPTFTVAAAGAIGTNMEVGLSIDTAAATFEGGVGITAERILTTTSPVGTPTIGAPTFTGTAVAAGPLIEVANATNLAALTGVRVEAYGQFRL